MEVTLAATHHDPEGRMYDQTVDVLPILTRTFNSIVVHASAATSSRSLALLSEAGVTVGLEDPPQPAGYLKLGKVRRETIALALRTGKPFVLFFDFDSMLHWAQHYPDELAAAVAEVPKHDLTIMGRSQRAFDTHPRHQRDTEAMVNQVFERLTGHAWDVMRSGRGLSRRVAEVIVTECPEEGISVDVVWPLFLLEKGGFTVSQLSVEGTEFETADRYAPEIATAGGYEQWLSNLDADPRRWAHRLHLARLHMEAMIPYAGPDTLLQPDRIARQTAAQQ